MTQRTTSVLVIGGGPGGTTAAALLAKAGIDVLLLEREFFPRYHIGESLLASCLPTLRLSGAFDAVAACGFTEKRGALIRWADDEWVLDWAKLVDPDAWSWQVDRATYDEVLLRNASRQGATVVEGASVKRIHFDGDRPVSAEWTKAGEAGTHRVYFDHVIDASGRNGVLAHQHLRLREQHKVFQNVAIWSYWDGATLLPDSPQGAINVVSSPEGWWWHIPLANNRFSIGLVTHKASYAALKAKHGTLEALYHDRLAATPAIRSVTTDTGARCTGVVRADQDYSYVSSRFCGPGYFCVGDSACFLDPLLSTGVHLAQYSALLASAALISMSRSEVSETEGLAFFELIYRRAYTRLLVLVTRMYEQYKGKDDYFWNAQKLVHEKARHGEAVRSFTDIMTGLTDLHEAGNHNIRIVGRQLMEEAEAAQDAKAQATGGGNLHALDVTATWGPWRSIVGADTAAGELALVTEPALGLARRGGASGAAVATQQ